AHGSRESRLVKSQFDEIDSRCNVLTIHVPSTHPAWFWAGRRPSGFPSIDRAFSKARPVRTALAHFVWRRSCSLPLNCDVATLVGKKLNGYNFTIEMSRHIKPVQAFFKKRASSLLTS